MLTSVNAQMTVEVLFSRELFTAEVAYERAFSGVRVSVILEFLAALELLTCARCDYVTRGRRGGKIGAEGRGLLSCEGASDLVSRDVKHEKMES